MSIDPSILTKIIAVEVNKDPGMLVEHGGEVKLILKAGVSVTQSHPGPAAATLTKGYSIRINNH